MMIYIGHSQYVLQFLKEINALKITYITYYITKDLILASLHAEKI
jgi:hypothetical protein